MIVCAVSFIACLRRALQVFFLPASRHLICGVAELVRRAGKLGEGKGRAHISSCGFESRPSYQKDLDPARGIIIGAAYGGLIWLILIWILV